MSGSGRWFGSGISQPRKGAAAAVASTQRREALLS
jgi:hypothetical protein